MGLWLGVYAMNNNAIMTESGSVARNNSLNGIVECAERYSVRVFFIHAHDHREDWFLQSLFRKHRLDTTTTTTVEYCVVCVYVSNNFIHTRFPSHNPCAASVASVFSENES